jgi:hypothetical protein
MVLQAARLKESCSETLSEDSAEEPFQPVF